MEEAERQPAVERAAQNPRSARKPSSAPGQEGRDRGRASSCRRFAISARRANKRESDAGARGPQSRHQRYFPSAALAEAGRGARLCPSFMRYYASAELPRRCARNPIEDAQSLEELTEAAPGTRSMRHPQRRPGGTLGRADPEIRREGVAHDASRSASDGRDEQDSVSRCSTSPSRPARLECSDIRATRAGGHWWHPASCRSGGSAVKKE